ncbi:Tfx family DNA-binding protein [Saliphagus infecundisoli]|uniref:Tfx family DNA-binding protein n=1 Tax=Saliphagus infecundisoli TaxID=1849069 RepID=A0ABD5Q9I2_9EURY|nr:Tfx family DNA-binding protein [Saliphagus infecundisoli]
MDSQDGGDLLAGFDPAEHVLTARQAQVLALRAEGYSQAEVADRIGTSRANVASIEGSARDNVAKARETVTFAETLAAPVRVTVPSGTDLYDVPDRVYDACDEADLTVAHAAPELLKLIHDAAGGAVADREVRTPIVVGVGEDGSVRVRRSG